MGQAYCGRSAIHSAVAARSPGLRHECAWTVRKCSASQGPSTNVRSLTVTLSSLPEEQMAALLEPAKRACYVSNTFAFVPSVTVELA